MTLSSISPNLSKHWRFLAFWLSLCFGSCLLFLVCHYTAFLFSTRAMRFWWNSVQRKALMRAMYSREIFTKKCLQQQIFDTDLKGAWHYNHVTFTPIAKNFMLYCRLIYMLSILCVRLTINVKVGIPESFKVGWYPPQKTGSSHLKGDTICGSASVWYREMSSSKAYLTVEQERFSLKSARAHL